MVSFLIDCSAIWSLAADVLTHTFHPNSVYTCITKRGRICGWSWRTRARRWKCCASSCAASASETHRRRRSTDSRLTRSRPTPPLLRRRTRAWRQCSIAAAAPTPRAELEPLAATASRVAALPSAPSAPTEATTASTRKSATLSSSSSRPRARRYSYVSLPLLSLRELYMANISLLIRFRISSMVEFLFPLVSCIVPLGLCAVPAIAERADGARGGEAAPALRIGGLSRQVGAPEPRDPRTRTELPEGSGRVGQQVGRCAEQQPICRREQLGGATAVAGERLFARSRRSVCREPLAAATRRGARARRPAHAHAAESGRRAPAHRLTVPLVARARRLQVRLVRRESSQCYLQRSCSSFCSCLCFSSINLHSSCFSFSFC